MFTFYCLFWKEVRLDQLRNITKEESSDLILLTENSLPSKACLIEEISSTTVPGELSTPPYELSVRKGTDGRPLKMELKVELPEVDCVSDCNLSISKASCLFVLLKLFCSLLS